MVRILAMAGSARRESFNKRLAQLAAVRARTAGADVTVIDLADYRLPLFDQDVEADEPPQNADMLRNLMLEHDGLLLACPEYNSSITPLLKNVIDWASRPVEGVAPLAAFKGKTAALVSASPGALGGLRGLGTVCSILSSIGVHVLPTQVAVGSAHSAFADGDRALNDPRLDKNLTRAMNEMVEMTAKLATRRE